LKEKKTYILWAGETELPPPFPETISRIFGKIEVISFDSAVEMFKQVSTASPFMTIVDARCPGFGNLLSEIKSASPVTSLLLLSKPEEMALLMADRMDHVDEFIPMPVNPVAAEVALRRAAEMTRLRRLAESAYGSTHEADLKDRVAARIQQERFVTVKQIAKSLSSFMGQIASHAQGGLRYFDEMPYMMAIHSRHCRVLTINPAYRQHLGDKVNRPSWEIYAKKRGAATSACPARRTIDTGKTATTRAVVQYRNGKKVPVIVHTSPVFNREGEVELVLEVFAGVKEIDRMARDIKTTQQRYRKLFDAVPNYIAVLDTELRVTAFNQRFFEDFGFKTGRKFHDIFKPGRAAAGTDPISRTLADATPHQGEMKLFSPQGEPLSLMAWTSPITTTAGKLIQVLVIFTDVTELRRLQDNLSRLGLMLSTISHSLKGSLTGLDAGLYMIEKGFYRDKPGRIEEGLELATAMTDRVRKIVRDILYYAKERTLEVQEVDAGEFAAEIASGIETRIRGADIRFETRFDGAGKIEIDAGLIRASLVNILENAIEACIADEAGKSNRIQFDVTGFDDHVLYTVKDNGIGMSETDIRNIFKLFWSSKGKSGTGLGLFISNNVVGKHGGKISVTSQPGRETCFTIRLPRKVNNPDA